MRERERLVVLVELRESCFTASRKVGAQSVGGVSCNPVSAMLCLLQHGGREGEYGDEHREECRFLARNPIMKLQ